VFPPLPPPAGAVTIRLAEPCERDGDAYARHLVEQAAESGRHGAPHFTPVQTLSRDEVRSAALGRWSKDLAEALWGRAFLLCAGDRVVGHLELRGGRLPAEMHRALLGMGISQAFTGQGHGRRLVEIAVAWARDEARLSWIDLGVFANNEPALRLYRRMGFVEQGTREDAFRIDGGVTVTDIQMALDLRRAG